MLDLELVRPADQIRAIPADRGKGMATLRAYHGLDPEFLGRIDHA